MNEFYLFLQEKIRSSFLPPVSIALYASASASHQPVSSFRNQIKVKIDFLLFFSTDET